MYLEQAADLHPPASRMSPPGRGGLAALGEGPGPGPRPGSPLHVMKTLKSIVRFQKETKDSDEDGRYACLLSAFHLRIRFSAHSEGVRIRGLHMR